MKKRCPIHTQYFGNLFFLTFMCLNQQAKAQEAPVGPCPTQAISHSAPDSSPDLAELIKMSKKINLNVSEADVAKTKSLAIPLVERSKKSPGPDIYANDFMGSGTSIVLVQAGNSTDDGEQNLGEQNDKFWMVGRYEENGGMSGEVQIGKRLNFHGGVSILSPLNKELSYEVPTLATVYHHNELTVASAPIYAAGPEVSLLLDVALNASYDGSSFSYSILPGAGVGVHIDTKRFPLKMGVLVSLRDTQFAGTDSDWSRQDYVLFRMSTPPF